MKQGYINIDVKTDTWVFHEADLILRNGTELEVFHNGEWQKAVIENQTFFYLYDIDEYKNIRCDVLVRVNL